MNAELEALALEDLHAARRLIVGCPIYGRFYGALHLQAAQNVLAEVCNTPARQCGYFDKRTGSFSVSPVR